MASIRYRAPWRVVVNGKTDPKGPFASEKQAQAYAGTLVAQGIDKGSIKVTQARSGSWARSHSPAFRPWNTRHTQLGRFRAHPPIGS